MEGKKILRPKTGETMNSVLVVEDFAPFRAFVSPFLREKLAFQIVSEASVGFEAVRRARELNPDLILLDIGLPGLNGIEAARQIRELSPTPRIVFLTQEGTEVVEEALNSGRLGYVHKSRAGSDLVLAIATVLEAVTSITMSNARNHGPYVQDNLCLRFLRSQPSRRNSAERWRELRSLDPGGNQRIACHGPVLAVPSC